MLKGIDVSGWQGKIDWEKAKKDGVQFAIIKLGNVYQNDTNDVDSTFERNYSECKRLNIPVGVYVYSYVKSTESAKRAANHVIEHLKGKTLELPVYLDLEDKTISNLGKNLLSDITITFGDMIEKAGYWAGIYANVNWLENILDMNRLSRFTVWVAQYYSRCEYTGKYAIWQYSSTGEVDGLSGNIDMNYLYDENIIKSSKGKEPEPAKKEKTTVLSWQKVMNKVYKCGLAEDNSYGPLSQEQANKHQLYKTKIGLFRIRNEYVRWLQNRLKELGYKIDVDGSFWEATEKVVKQFQRDRKLKDDGYVGKNTVRELLK